jgi:inosose dehydratase
MSIRIGCVPLQWGQFSKAHPEEYTPERILREVAQAGFEGISSGVRKNQTPEELAEHLRGFGLVPAPGYLGGDWWKPEEAEMAVERATTLARFSKALGVSECFISAGGFGGFTSRRNGKNRWELAGQIEEGDGLDDAEWKVLSETINRIGRAMAEEGVKACYHNHVGAVVETRAEMERLIELTDRDAVFLGPDTGHLYWGGADPVAFFRDFGPHIKAVHLKDASEEIRAQGVAKGWTYDEFSQAGLWRELGEGDIDFSAVFKTLEENSFDGWALSETDVTQKSTPLESAQISRKYLKQLGY